MKSLKVGIKAIKKARAENPEFDRLVVRFGWTNADVNRIYVGATIGGIKDDLVRLDRHYKMCEAQRVGRIVGE